MLEIRKLTDRGARWILRNAPRPLSVDGVVSRYREGVRAASALIPELASEPIRDAAAAAAARLVEAQVPEALAGRLALCSELSSALDIAEVAWRCLGAAGPGAGARGGAPGAARDGPEAPRDDRRGRRARRAGVVRGSTRSSTSAGCRRRSRPSPAPTGGRRSPGGRSGGTSCAATGPSRPRC